MSAGRGTAAPGGLLREVIQRFAVALIFGALISGLASWEGLRSLTLVERVRQEGAAIALRVSVVWNERLALAAEKPEGTTAVTLLDIDEGACAELVGFVPCRFDRIGHAEVLDEALAAADAAGPAVIVFDILLPGMAAARDTEAGRRLLERVSKPGPAIIAPIAHGEVRDGVITVNWAQSLCGRPRCGRLRFAPAFATSRFGSARSYPVVATADVVPDILAASDDVERISISSIAGATLEALHGRRIEGADLPIVYTIPSFATLSDGQLGAAQAAYFDNVEFLRFSQLSREGSAWRLPARPGRLLVIGTSAPIADDWHDTPLGAMSGMEVVANAIRTFEMERGGKAPVSGRWMFDALAWAVLLAVIFLLALVQRARARRSAERLQGARAIIPDRYSLLTLLVLIAAVIVEALIQVADVVYSLKDPRARTGDLDILLPLFAIFFTTAVELSHRLIRRLEAGVAWLVDRIGRRPSTGRAAQDRDGR